MTPSKTIAAYEADMLEELAYWHEEVTASSDDPQYQMLAASMRDQLTFKRERFDALKGQLKLGLELRSSFAWCILLKDPSHVGCYRYQLFDERGFSGHVTRATLEQAFIGAFNEGFDVEDDGALLRSWGTEAWHHGMRVCELAQQLSA